MSPSHPQTLSTIRQRDAVLPEPASAPKRRANESQEDAARLGNDTLYYYLPRFLTTHPKKGSFELRFQLKLIGLGWNQLNLWL